MAIGYYNEMRVYGKRKYLDYFKHDVAGDCENEALSFQNIMHAARETSEREDTVRASIYLFECQPKDNKYRGIPYAAINSQIDDEGEFLRYTFGTRHSAPYRIYEKLIDKYTELDFEIYIKNDQDYDREELAFRKGQLSKDFEIYWQCVPWRDGKFKYMLYRKDHLKGTLQVIEERILSERIL